MPDQRTALMGDDFTNSGLFMFVADKAADLSAGNLYVAKISQTSAKGGPAAASDLAEHQMDASWTCDQLKSKPSSTNRYHGCQIHWPQWYLLQKIGYDGAR